MKHGIIRKLVMAGFVIVGLVVIGLLVLKQMAQAPPGYYAEIIKAEKSIDEKSRHEQAEVLVGDVVQVRNDIANDPEWTFRLTDKSIVGRIIFMGRFKFTRASSSMENSWSRICPFVKNCTCHAISAN